MFAVALHSFCRNDSHLALDLRPSGSQDFGWSNGGKDCELQNSAPKSSERLRSSFMNAPISEYFIAARC